MSEVKARPLLDNDDDLDEGDSQQDKYLTFRVGNEDYALGIGKVIEIVGILPVTEVPDMPAFVRGVINLRGRVIPAIDVRLRFGMEPRTYDQRTCVIVVDLAGTAIGLIVDTVSEVISIPPSALSPPPMAQHGGQNRFVKGLGRVGESVKILLDLENLLDRGMGF